MPLYRVKVISSYPETRIEEIVEIECEDMEEATEIALEGGGDLVQEMIDYGPSRAEVVTDMYEV